MVGVAGGDGRKGKGDGNDIPKKANFHFPQNGMIFPLTKQ